jgi:Immunity protein 72/Immunity protein 71
MMTEQDRSKVFWLLKKYSSYTAWKALGDAYFVFADAYMKAIELVDHSRADPLDEEAFADEAKRILTGRIGFEQGLPRLKQGDRSVWRRNSRGALVRGNVAIDFINQILNPQEFVLEWMKNLDEVKQAQAELRRTRKRLGAVTERAADRPVTVIGRNNAFDVRFGPFNFPPQLPEVPHPTTIVIATGEEVPFDGIYEPEWGPLPDAPNPGLLAKIKTLLGNRPSLMDDQGGDGLATVRHRDIGCMNYLLSCTQAPLYQDGELDPAIPVHWRLIWKDTRYLDGLIPDEEAEYLATAVIEPTTRLRCEAGQPCPADGEWSTPSAQGTRHFKQGEIMPDMKSDYGQTIWYCEQSAK